MQISQEQEKTETASKDRDHKVSDDYQHKERRRRGLKRKVSAHSSEERERGMDRRGEEKQMQNKQVTTSVR